MTEFEIFESLIKLALKGQLNMDDFNDKWPVEDESIDFFNILYNDIESAIEHYPVSLIKMKELKERWLNSREYHVLNVDLELLQNGLEEQDFIVARKKMISS